MAPFIANPAFRLHPMLSRVYVRLLNVHSKICKLPSILLHKLHPVVFNHLEARDLPPFSFYHPDDVGPGPSNPESFSSNTSGNNVGAGGVGASPGHRFYPTPLNRLSIWATLALAFVILVVVTVISYMIYSCYHSAGSRVKNQPKVSVVADGSGIKGGWQTLEDPSGEARVKDRDAEEKIDEYQDENKKNGVINPWSERRVSGLKGLGIQLHRGSKSQYDFTSRANQSQGSIIYGSPHSTCGDRSLGSTSDREHEQDLGSSEGSDCPSMSAEPLAHTTDRSATCLPFHIPPPLPLPLPLPLPPPVTPSPQPIKQKKTRLRALTQILSHKLTQNLNGREMYFELQPMITPGNKGGQTKGLSSTLDESSPSSPSPQSKFSPAQFAYFAPYPNCNSTSNSTSNCNNSSCSPTTFPTTPITPLTPITPVTPVTPIKSGSTAAIVAELQFDSNNIQFVETPARTPDVSPGAFSVNASPPEIQGGLASVSLTRAEMLWNDPKLSPVQGAFGVVGGEKTNLMTMEIGPTEMALAKTRAVTESQLDSPTTSVWQTESPFESKHRTLVSIPTLATPDQVHRGHANLRLGYLRRGVSLSSPPSPSPSSRSSYSSSDSASSSPSLATARFFLDRDELNRDNLRNRDRTGLIKEKGRENMKPLSPIPRPVFLPQPQPPRLQAEDSF